MNPRITKTIEEIERTRAKIAELQTLLPELERKRIDLENTEIVRLMRTAHVAPGDIADFISRLKTGGITESQAPEPVAAVKSEEQPNNPDTATVTPVPSPRESRRTLFPRPDTEPKEDNSGDEK